MAGLEQIAAIVGLTEFGFRSIFLLYNAIKDLRNVPEEIESIRVEIGVLQQCLIEFQIQTADNEHLAAAVKRFGFPRALEHCEQACAKLSANLHIWTVLNGHSWRKRIGYFIHKKETGEVLRTIRTAKETIVLTIVGSQLSLQSQHQITLDDIAYHMSSNPIMTEEKTSLSGDGKTLQHPSSETQSSARECVGHSIVRTIQEFKKTTEAGGDRNKVGMSKDAQNKGISQTFHGTVKTSGSDNVVGIW